MSAGRAADASAGTRDGRTWTVMELIRWSADYLTGKGVETGRLDAELLLSHALDLPRLQLYLQFDRPLELPELDRYRPLLRRRGAREPLQYIVGRTGFRELELRVDRRALIPRPETEDLVDEVLAWARGRGRDDLTALDVGTGSGAIALSLAREGPFARIVATDVSAEALDLARGNGEAVQGSAAVEFRVGSVFEPLGAGERFDVIVSNPPYVADPEADGLAPEILDWEPAEALFAGPDGLDVVRALVAGAADHVEPGGLLALEIGGQQAPSVVELLERAGGWTRARIRRDLAGRERIVLAEAPERTARDDSILE